MKMKKYLLVLGLILSPVLAVAADCPQMQQQQDQAFVETLARQVEAPASPALPEAPQAIAAVFCPAVWCTEDGNCWDNCPGGVGGSYCNRAQHKCYPY